jgi:putative tryptophan/tyrosine transport system substrate-binding protein
MKRREFIGLLAGAVGWPLATRANPDERMRLIGVIMTQAAKDPVAQDRVKAFAHGLGEHGWKEGNNILVEYRFADGDVNRVSTLAQELVRIQPEVIVTNAIAPISAVRQWDRAIPIVFAAVADPVGAGLIKGVSRPEDNVTGFTTFEYSIVGKWVELLKAIAPGLSRVGIMFNPEGAYRRGAHWLEPFRSAAFSFAVNPIELPVRDVDEIGTVVAEFGVEQSGGLLVANDTFTSAYHAQITAATARHRIPGCYGFRYFVADGGLMSYGPDSADLYRRAASYVDRILRGERLANLPIQQPTKFELVINIKTAKVMGLTVPPWLLVRADEVIE